MFVFDVFVVVVGMDVRVLRVAMLVCVRVCLIVGVAHETNRRALSQHRSECLVPTI